jgi:DNA-binding transcriptional LysR family regulator
MELIWIEDFLALADTGNFTRAAERRNTTQPAYSRRVQRLEAWLGTSLFEREARPVALTPAGQEFLERAKRLREDILDSRRAVRSLASIYGHTTRLYTTNTLAIGFLASWMAKTGLTNYSLIVASVSGCLEALRHGRGTLALIPSFGGEEDLGPWPREVVGKDQLVLLATPEVAARIAVVDGRLTGPMLVYAPGTAYGMAINEVLAAEKITLAELPVCESASAEALAVQVRAGLGAGWVPQSLAAPELVRCAVPAGLDAEYEIVMLYRKG